MSNAAAPLEVLIDELKRLPGIGDKSATRLAYQLMNLSAEQTEKLVAHQAEPLPPVPELYRGRSVPHLRRPQAGPLHHLRGGDRPRRPGHRAHPGIPRAVPCPVRPHQPGERGGPGKPDHPRTGEPTRLASGVPVGSRLEQADRQTIFRALEGRLEL